MPLFVTIILDGLGVGHAPDAEDYGDSGANTVASVCHAARPDLPNLTALGLGALGDFAGLPAVADPQASVGVMTPVSAGKDSTTGHWELAGIILDRPFPTYPEGFPSEVVETFLQETDCRGVLANKPASGTDVVEEFGQEHLLSGWPIVYTSADSVFQIAAHTDAVSLDTLYDWCRVARERVCVDDHAVGRVIARPFLGPADRFERISDARKDFALEPPPGTVQGALRDAGVRTVAVGKIGDLFANAGFDDIIKTSGNTEGIERTIEAIRSARGNAFVWVNLVDFDQLYGHRNDPQGFARALEEFDRALPEIIGALPEDGRLLLTADHGNDPCFPGTDHTRERVPILLVEPGRTSRDLGVRDTFADHAATVAEFFGAGYQGPGSSFLR